MNRKKILEASTRVFSCEFYEVFQYSFFGCYCSCKFMVFKKTDKINISNSMYVNITHPFEFMFCFLLCCVANVSFFKMSLN